MADEPQTPDDVTAAFDALSARLAGLTAAVDGFAARQQELVARDYATELATLQINSEKMISALRKVGEMPAMQFTPDAFAKAVDKASSAARDADHRAWGEAQRQLGEAIQTISARVASAASARHQRRWIAGVAAAAMVVGFVLGDTIPTRIARAAPEGWYWPEERAASILGRDGWSAGQRMMQVSDPGQWRALSNAARLVSENAGALAVCEERAARSDKPQTCTITVSGQVSLPIRSKLLPTSVSEK